MEVLETDILAEDTLPEIQDPFQEDIDQYVRGRFLRYGVGLIFVLYAIIGFALEIHTGFYAIKIAILASTGLLLFSPPSYPYLLGLLIPVYYYLKTHQAAMVEYNYTAHFTPVMIILMTIFHWVWKQFGDYKRNPYQRFDLGSFCLLGIIGFAILGCGVIENRFFYFNRMVYLLGFGCAFYLGRSCLNTQQSLKLLLMGLALGIFAFELPYSVGYVLRHGVSVIGRLDLFRAELGAGTAVGSESGTVLVIFALAYSLSSSGVSAKIRRIALWLVAIPAAIVIMIFLSKGAVLLLPATVLLNLILSGRRRAAIVVALISVIFGVMLFLKFPGVFLSFAERMAGISEVAHGRHLIALEGIRHGLSHPLRGIGAGQYSVVGSIYTAHNEEITLFAEHGIIALFLYILFWIYLVYMALKLRVSKDFFMRSMVGVFVVLMAVHFAYIQIQPMYFNRGGLLFNFLVGMLVTLYYRSRSEQEVPEGL